MLDASAAYSCRWWCSVRYLQGTATYHTQMSLSLPPEPVSGTEHTYLIAKNRLRAGSAVGTMMASLAEGLGLAAQAGLSQAELLDIISLGAMANPMFKLKAREPCPLQSQHDTRGRLINVPFGPIMIYSENLPESGEAPALNCFGLSSRMRMFASAGPVMLPNSMHVVVAGHVVFGDRGICRNCMSLGLAAGWEHD